MKSTASSSVLAYRYAIYFSPKETALARFGAAALGYDIHTGADVAPTCPGSLDADQWSDLTSRARGYGFHATLKAPFRLAQDTDESALLEAFEAFCDQHHAVSLPGLAVREHHGFLAVTPSEQSAELFALERKIVEDFEPFRASLTEAEVARRKPHRLTDRQKSYLDRFGYPFVFDDFQFHMTLSAFVGGEPFVPSLLAELDNSLQQALETEETMLDSLTLAQQKTPEAAFLALDSRALK